MEYEFTQVQGPTQERPLSPWHGNGGAVHGVDALREFTSGFERAAVEKFTYPVSEEVQIEKHYIPALSSRGGIADALLAQGVELSNVKLLSVEPVGKGIIHDPLDELSALEAPVKLSYLVEALDGSDECVEEKRFDALEEAREFISRGFSQWTYRVSRVLEDEPEARVGVEQREGYTVTLSRAVGDVSYYVVK